MPAISLTAVPLTAPDGTRLTPDLTLSFGPERTGLVGPNGAGKSTLLHLLAGTAPAAGVDRQGRRAALLVQSWPDLSIPVAEALGQSAPLARLARIAEGAPEADDIDGADWTLEARIDEGLARAGLSGMPLSRPLATLSGGQRTRVGLARLFLEAPDILLMDEPTNNLDAAGRALVAETVATWPGGVVVASHDRALLEGMDRIVEITPAGAHVTGGGWSAHRAERDARRAREAAALERADREATRLQRELQAQKERAARRAQAGKKARATGSQPKVMADYMADRAGRTQGADRRRAERLEGAAEAAREAASAQVSPARALRFRGRGCAQRGAGDPRRRARAEPRRLHPRPAQLHAARRRARGAFRAQRRRQEHADGRAARPACARLRHAPRHAGPCHARPARDRLRARGLAPRHPAPPAPRARRERHPRAARPATASATPPPTPPPPGSPAANGCGRRWRPRWAVPRRRCCCSTSPPTTWISKPWNCWRRRSPATPAPSSPPATTRPSSRPSASPARSPSAHEKAPAEGRAGAIDL